MSPNFCEPSESLSAGDRPCSAHLTDISVAWMAQVFGSMDVTDMALDLCLKRKVNTSTL